MLEKQIITGRIEILSDGQIQLREDTVILEDGIEISRTYHRMVLEPGSKVSILDKRVNNIAQMIWTGDVVQAFKDQQTKIK